MTSKQQLRTDIQNLLDIMATLRDPVQGCPWDREQDFASIAPYTIEEAYEVADVIERGAYAELAAELGDLLFQVVYHARLAEEQGLFDFAAVVATISDKLVRRHPHVFAEAEVEGAQAQTVAWERLKRAERASSGQHGRLDGIPKALPALTRAAKLGRRAAEVGFDWSSVAGVRNKLDEEVTELDAALASQDRAQCEHELGDVLLTLASLARHLDVDPEAALRHANERFARRFAGMERALDADGESWRTQSAAALEQRWQQAKRSEADDP